MHELDKHRAAFEEYYTIRNILAVSRKTGISRQALGSWKKEFLWTKRCEERDQGINETVNAVMIPQYTAVKVTLIQAFLNQINDAVKKKISPETSRDMVAISRELRALLGEGEKLEVEFTGIEYVLTKTQE